jgi:hypothetical protein
MELKRQVFDKNKFNETVDTTFSQLSSKQDPNFFDINLATQNDLFILYKKFFYDIPKEGEIESHQFIIDESTDYVGVGELNDNLKALLDEISLLREENLELRQQNIFLLLRSTGIITESEDIESLFNTGGGTELTR